LKQFGTVNIGAAGTFVIQRAVTPTQLRAELARRLPFDTEIMVCQGRDVVRLMSMDIFARQPAHGIVGFVSVLSRPPRVAPRLPMTFPTGGQWLLKVLAREGRFVVGQYRRHMKVIGYLGSLDRIFGVPATTRNWTTMAAIVKVLVRGTA
jgi:hypothetical protein